MTEAEAEPAETCASSCNVPTIGEYHGQLHHDCTSVMYSLAQTP